VAFDLMRGAERLGRAAFRERAGRGGFVTPWVVHEGAPLGVDEALELLGSGRHGAVGPAEGAVWRLEHGGAVILVAKCVRREKVDGNLLAESTGAAPVWNVPRP
jgi:hypothetical protein